MLFVLPGFLVYLYSGASVFTAAQKSHPLMRTFVMCFSNGCQNPNNIYWKPATDTRWNTRPRSWWQARLWILMVENFWNILTSSHCGKKHRNTELALFVYCSGVLFFSLTFSIVSCTMSLFIESTLVREGFSQYASKSFLLRPIWQLWRRSIR